jgi:hypothetical protein
MEMETLIYSNSKNDDSNKSSFAAQACRVVGVLVSGHPANQVV